VLGAAHPAWVVEALVLSLLGGAVGVLVRIAAAGARARD
jgi:hypothetical protein